MGRTLSIAGGPGPPWTTPLCLIGLRGGVVPHLTRETLAHLAAPPAFLAPSAHVLAHVDVLEQYGQGLARFMGQPDQLTWLTPVDPAQPDRLGYHQTRNVALWRQGNKMLVTPQSYMRAVTAAQPTVFVALCDGQTPPDASAKRIAQSAGKSLAFLDECLRLKDAAPTLSRTLVFGAVQGGRDRQARARSARQTAERPVDGFLIDGCHVNGPESETLAESPVVADLLTASLSALPEDKPRLYQGACSPATVLQWVERGIDVFEPSYAYHATDRGHALTFPNVLAPRPDADAGLERNGQLPAGPDPPPLTLDLGHVQFQRDLSPLVAHCSCYTCRKHTRAYIHHLLVTREMLGPVLLTLHNLHHYATFFQTIRECCQTDSLPLLQAAIAGVTAGSPP
eukprot:maker-scaffold941_size78300-snap-gene-0.16 protein:Tk00810 transcript:maker-scaffold941_size78300-snap-gene-0.16-mRNA-1 annotation:"queuine trna-ribosyltransferase subunit qtrtd1"